MEFVGREDLLGVLSRDLADVAVTGAGKFVLVRGRRRVGKSRLVEEFLQREKPPSVFFSASRQSAARELELFSEALARSGLRAASVVRGEGSLVSWDSALSLVGATASRGDPTVLVIDEFPFLKEGDPGIDGTFQKLWDRELQSQPVLVIVVGSDLAMMEKITEYGQPLYGRPTRIVSVPPFSPAELSQMCGVDPAVALDGYLVLGGFPLIAQTWRQGQDLMSFLKDSLADPTSALIVDGERSLSAEFPSDVQARRVLEAIGSGQRTFTAIGSAAGLPQSSLQRALDFLVETKRVVARRTPVSAKTTKERRYTVADPYLRFWLQFIGPSLSELERGRSDIVLDRIRASWATYRGRAIEPVVVQSVERLLPDLGFSGAARVGAFWTRSNDTEVDVVVLNDGRSRDEVEAIGSIKWREAKPFTANDRDQLVRQAAAVPGVGPSTRLMGISRSGFSAAGMDVELGPEQILKAWDRPVADYGERA